jgi:phage baseplate assembly protein W
MTIVKTKTPKNIDLDLNFTIHPVTKDVSRLVDNNAIITSVINLCRTKNGERPFHPEIGCQATGLLFEPFTSSVKAAMERAIKYTIDNFEPRVNLISAQCYEDKPRKAIQVTIVFEIVATAETVQTSFFLERTI